MTQIDVLILDKLVVKKYVYDKIEYKSKKSV